MILFQDNAGELSLFKEFGGKGGSKGVAAAAGEEPETVEDEMGAEELGDSLLESGEQDVDELQLAEHVSMEMETTDVNSEGEAEEEARCGEHEEDNHEEKQKLKKTKKSGTAAGGVAHTKLRQKNRKKTSVVTSETIKATEPGGHDTRKRKKSKVPAALTCLCYSSCYSVHLLLFSEQFPLQAGKAS